MADTPKPPVEVNPNPLGAQAATAMRDVGIVVSFLVAAIGFMSGKDWQGLRAFIGSSDAAPAIALIAGLAIAGWRQWHARRETATKVLAATSRPNTNVVVKGTPAAAEAVRRATGGYDAP